MAYWEVIASVGYEDRVVMIYKQQPAAARCCDRLRQLIREVRRWDPYTKWPGYWVRKRENVDPGPTVARTGGA
jgi:hypothetical protein